MLDKSFFSKTNVSRSWAENQVQYSKIERKQGLTKAWCRDTANEKERVTAKND
jgi:hypothetical protein